MMKSIRYVALTVAVVSAACADSTATGVRQHNVTPTTAVLSPITDGSKPAWTLFGEVWLCKQVSTGDPATNSFDFTVSTSAITLAPPAAPTNAAPGFDDVAAGESAPDNCTRVYDADGDIDHLDEVVITETAQPNWSVSDIVVQQYFDGAPTTPPYPAGVTTASVDEANRTATVRGNNEAIVVVTFVNDFTLPACDFITYGRIVTEIGGKKVVISGNAGGNNADGSIKNEFHIEFNDVDYHVADAITYGPIAAGPLSSLTNSRVVTGTAKNGTAVELRLWDGGEPGKGTDIVWFSLNGSVKTAAAGQFITQGNMQYHTNCRGPG